MNLKMFDIRPAKRNLLILLIVPLLSGCGIYSFSGASIDPAANTVYVGNFPNNAEIVAPGLSATFTEKLRDKFISETRLNLVSQDGDLSFTGYISEYVVVPAGVQSNERAALSRLRITIQVEYKNKVDETSNFKKKFSSFQDFPGNQALSQVEDQLIDEITTRIVQDIFNDSVNNW